MNTKIYKNSFYLIIGQIIIKIISFFYVIFLAGNLGVISFGLYSAALAYFSLVSSFVDFGLNRFLIREGAIDEQKLIRFASSITLIRLVLAVAFFVIFAIWLVNFDKDINRIQLSILAIAAVIPQSLAMTFDSILIAKEKLKASAMFLLILSIFTTLAGIIMIISGYGAFGAVSALIFGELIYALALFWAVNDYLKFSKFDLIWVREIIRGALPYAIFGILGLLYFKVDTLMLSYIKGSEQTGLYGAAYRFLEAVVFVPSAFAASAFPSLARLHKEDISQVKKIYFKSLKTLAILSIPVFLGYIFILPWVISWLLPNYSGSIQAIKILAFTIPFMFVHVSGATVLMASDRFLKPIIYLSVLTLGLNILLNLLFIPQYGYIGASYVTVGSEAFSFVVFFVLLYQKLLKHV